MILTQKALDKTMKSKNKEG